MRLKIATCVLCAFMFCFTPIKTCGGMIAPKPIKNTSSAKIVKEEPYYFKSIPLSKNIQKYIYDTCKKYNVNYLEVLAIIKHESSYNAKAISYNGTSFGLMQIHKINHKRLKSKLGIKDLFNPYDNVKAGIYMLSELNKYPQHKKYIAYNMGEGGMRKAISRGVRSTKYSRDIMLEIERLKRIQLKEEK